MWLWLILGMGVVIGFALWVAYMRIVHWSKEAQRTRFLFVDRDTYLFLRVDRPLGSDDGALVSMRALREALQLKLAGVGYRRLLVEASHLRLANKRAFWLFIGALGPALRDRNVRVAVVCRRRTQASKIFHDSGVLTPFPCIRDAEVDLRSNEAPRPFLLDPEQLDALLMPGGRRAA